MPAVDEYLRADSAPPPVPLPLPRPVATDVPRRVRRRARAARPPRHRGAAPRRRVAAPPPTGKWLRAIIVVAILVVLGFAIRDSIEHGPRHDPDRAPFTVPSLSVPTFSVPTFSVPTFPPLTTRP